MSDKKFDYDLFVIGAGSGGVRAGRWSAGLGAKVAICEEYRYGGTCVIRGCVPKKLMVYASEFHDEMEGAKNYGWTVENAKFDWGKLKENRDKEISRLEGIYGNLLEGKGVDRYNGRGVIKGPHTVEVNGKEYSAERILIAVGGRPHYPDIEGREFIQTSNDIFQMESQPQSVLIVGSGFIAVEFAGVFHGLGSEVDLALRKDYILKTFDKESTDFLIGELERKNLSILKNTEVAKIEMQDNKRVVTFKDGTSKTYESVIYATGRRPNTDSLGLENAGVETGRFGEILVNDHFQSNISSIYAVGDCIHRIQLTPVATTEGTKLAEHWFNGKDIDMTYENIPSAVSLIHHFLRSAQQKKKREINIKKLRYINQTLGP